MAEPESMTKFMQGNTAEIVDTEFARTVVHVPGLPVIENNVSLNKISETEIAGDGVTQRNCQHTVAKVIATDGRTKIDTVDQVAGARRKIRA